MRVDINIFLRVTNMKSYSIWEDEPVRLQMLMNIREDFLSRKNAINATIAKASKSNKWFEERLGGISLESYMDFMKIPKMSKATLRTNEYMESVLDEISNCKLEITSGSTGEPLKCYKNQKEIIKLNLIMWQKRRHVDNDVNINNFFSMYGMYTRKKIGDLFDLDKDNVLYCLKKILEEKPRWLYGSVSVVERYATVMKEAGLKNETIKFIELAGETVDPGVRKYIEEIFGAKIINHYGIRESWCIAYECINGKMHVCENVFAENDENGELVITNTVLHTMPLIRYKTGDIGKVEYIECECGLCSPIICLSGGRKGQIISGSKNFLGDIFFKRLFSRVIVDGFEGIRSYNVEQWAEKEFIVKLAYDDEVDEKMKNEIEAKIIGMIRKRLDDNSLVIKIIRVKSIDLINGKRIAFKNICKGKER